MFNGINFGFKDNKFYVQYQCSRPVGNLREEFERRAVDLYSTYPKIILGLSTGIDSQVVLHSFFKQNIPIEIAFLYLKNCNENELQRLEVLRKKYKFNPIIIDMDPNEIKEEVLHLQNQTGLPPYQIIHLFFLNKLPDDYAYVQGMSGPDIVKKKDGQWYLFESANSIEISRLRALQLSKRKGDLLAWERTGEILLSFLTDDIYQSFLHSFQYISDSGLTHNNGEKIELVDYWDTYHKPFYYGKYWKDELIYFPKYQGLETITWITEKKWHDYRKHLIHIPYQELIDHLSKADNTIIKFSEPNKT